MSDSGFSVWQILPLCKPDEYDSPYMSVSSFAGNTDYIDLEILFEQGLLTKDELEKAKQDSPYSLCRSVLGKQREKLLEKAYSRFADRQKLFEFERNEKQISKACEFLTLRSQNKEKCWQEWTVPDLDKDLYYFNVFLQFEFYSQWEKLKEYANKKNIEILGDLPFYVSADSSDVWADRKNFLLDEKGKPEKVSGVPPDYFSSEGQLWGNPIYNFEEMEKDGFSWWKERITHACKLYDCIRLDHFRAFSEYWAIPADKDKAIYGKWEKAPGEKIIDIIKQAANGKQIIAENLGIIDEKVDKLLDYSSFPGMAVFQFGFDGNHSNPHLPHNYSENTVAFTGTHDNNTLLGFIWEQDERTRREILDYVGFPSDNFDGCYETILRMLLCSKANTVVFPIQDILGFGSDTRLNTPGKADGNWKFRITKDNLSGIDRAKWKKMNSMYSRGE